LLGIIRAALKNLTAGHVRQGGSTITQQLARNSFSLKERTYRRKLLEIFLAKRIEDNFNKQKILELYLNRIYFGRRHVRSRSSRARRTLASLRAT
jgi:Membrane carboxypeptidase/penicillin-binding protein